MTRTSWWKRLFLGRLTSSAITNKAELDTKAFDSSFVPSYNIAERRVEGDPSYALFQCSETMRELRATLRHWSVDAELNLRQGFDSELEVTPKTCELLLDAEVQKLARKVRSYARLQVTRRQLRCISSRNGRQCADLVLALANAPMRLRARIKEAVASYAPSLQPVALDFRRPLATWNLGGIEFGLSATAKGWLLHVPSVHLANVSALGTQSVWRVSDEGIRLVGQDLSKEIESAIAAITSAHAAASNSPYR